MAGNWELGPQGPDDEFLMALLDDVGAHYCVDLDRVHIAGLSLGAWKAAVTACAHPDRIASIALVTVEVRPGGCGPMSVVAFHGTGDHVVPYGDGADPGVVVGGGNAGLPGVSVNMPQWALGAGCSDQRDVVRIEPDVEHWTYRDCPAGMGVEFYSIEHGDHTWPGTAIDPPGHDADDRRHRAGPRLVRRPPRVDAAVAWRDDGGSMASESSTERTGGRSQAVRRRRSGCRSDRPSSTGKGVRHRASCRDPAASVGAPYSIRFAEHPATCVRVDDTSYTVRRTPTWAVVLAVVTAFILLLGLLFLLVKEDQRVQRATVTVFTATDAYPFVMHGRTAADAYRIWYPLLAAGPRR